MADGGVGRATTSVSCAKALTVLADDVLYFCKIKSEYPKVDYKKFIVVSMPLLRVIIGRSPSRQAYYPIELILLKPSYYTY